MKQVSQSIAFTPGHVEVGFYNEADIDKPEATVAGWGATTVLINSIFVKLKLIFGMIWKIVIIDSWKDYQRSISLKQRWI